MSVIGRGDGTFRPATSLGPAAIPINVADFNGDRFADILVVRGADVEILPGNGDGTFRAPRLVARDLQPYPDARHWSIAADLDGDGHRDVAVRRWNGLNVYPGNGDFTFGTPVVLELPYGGTDGISADVNGDGRRDIIVAGLCCVTLFLNQGGLLFAPREIPVGADLTDITRGDLNADGRVDLIASEWPGLWGNRSGPGSILVFLGNGDGTFKDSARYDTGLQGEMSIVVGDFNRDGRLDVATGNQSALLEWDDSCCQLGDSISIMPGDGTGKLGPATSYSLNAVNPFPDGDPLYPGGHHQLNTSDLDGDRQTDLIASPAVVLLNRPPASNRPPVAFAGPDETIHYDLQVTLRGQASDPDMHWLTYAWTDQSGRLISTLPWTVTDQVYGTVRTYTLTVDDGHGGTASDSVTVTVTGPAPYMTLERPTALERVPAGRPYVIRWRAEASGIPGDDVVDTDIFVSTDGGQTYVSIPECTDPTSAGTSTPPPAWPGSRQCTWNAPSPVSSNARIRIVARTALLAVGEFISPEIAIVPAGSDPAALPPGCSDVDIGDVGATGRATITGSTYTVTGSGADIWGAADAFHYVACPIDGAFELTTRVAAVQNVSRWTKAGLMVRESLSPGARHVSLFATPTLEKGVAFQRRLTEGGLSIHNAGPSADPPVWLKLTRRENVISAYTRTAIGRSWRLVGRQTIDLPESVYIGFAVSSHVDGRLATVTFDRITLDRLPIFFTAYSNIGTPFQSNPTGDGVTITCNGSGADIGGPPTRSITTSTSRQETAPSPRGCGASRTHTRGQRPASCSGRTSLQIRNT